MAGGPVPICKTSDVPENTVRLFEIEGRHVAVYNVDGTFYATDDECTHGAASLSEGVVDGDVIECPLHFACFDVRTGALLSGPIATNVPVYEVRVEGETVYVRQGHVR